MKKFGCVVLSLLIGTAACSAMAGCGKSYDGEVNVYNWGDYIANGEDGTLDVIDEFEKEYNIKVNYTTYETNTYKEQRSTESPCGNGRTLQYA